MRLICLLIGHSWERTGHPRVFTCLRCKGWATGHSYIGHTSGGTAYETTAYPGPRERASY